MRNNATKTTYVFCCVSKLLLALVLFCLPAFLKAQTSSTLDFNGSGAHAEMGNLNSPGNFSSGLTIECWVKWESFQTWSRLIDFSNGMSSDNIILANESTTSRLRFEVYQGSILDGITSPVNMSPGRWYHVAVTQTAAGLVTIYIDGNPVTSGNLHLPNDISRSLNYIGKSAWNVDGYFHGKIDEFRIWNIARTGAEISKHMLKPVEANATGLIAYYRCNEGSGISLNNTCTNGYAANGFAVDGLSWQGSPVQLSPNAIDLDGTNDYVHIGFPLHPNSSYTKEAWIYVTKNTFLPQNVISSNGSPLWIDGGSLRAGNNGSAFELSDPGLMPYNTWVHVAVSYDAVSNEMRLYRDGMLVAATISINPYAGGMNYIGAWDNGAAAESFLGGKIDEVRVWNVVRSQGDILANMKKELNPSVQTGLVAYYNFNQGAAEGNNGGMITALNPASNTNGTMINFALNGTASNFVPQQSDITILPVLFGSFTAQKQNNNVHLRWTTLREQDAVEFVIEHSTDGHDWKSLGKQQAAGNSQTERHYGFIHSAPAAGTNYYRIAEKDAGGQVHYSMVRTITVSANDKHFELQGNVIRDQVLKLKMNKTTVLSLYSANGQRIWSKEVEAGRRELPLGSLNRGIYLLTDGLNTERLVIQ